MSPSASTIRILAIRPWTEMASLRSAVRGLGYGVHVTSVDIEPALNAALARGRFDVVVYDPSTPTISREMLAARMREHGRDIPVVEITTIAEVVQQIAKVLALRMN